MEMQVCRIWWPRHLTLFARTSLLIGWINLSTDRCLDVVVATAVASNPEEIPVLTNAAALGVVQLPQQEVQCNGHALLHDVHICAWRAILLEHVQGKPMWLPVLDSVILDGTRRTPNVQYVVFYKQPRRGSHHFRVDNRDFLPLVPAVNRTTTPTWLSGLQQQQRGPNIELITNQLNSAVFVEGTVRGTKGRSTPDSSNVLCYLFRIPRRCLFLLVKLHYALARSWLSVSSTYPYLNTTMKTSYTFKLLESRCQEFRDGLLSFLQQDDEGHDQLDVAVLHRRDIVRHSTCSKLLLDLTLGLIVAIWVLSREAFIMFAIGEAFQFVTNVVLRSGLIWLMGVPAGFKLNNDIAGALGNTALNVIQAFSTICGYVLSHSNILLRVFALASGTLGISVAGATLVDMLRLATAHVTLLQAATASLYGIHLKILAALWRLFRGRKQNPLRDRTDSYDSSVTQLVVASLMFTPLLLLLPTTSIFYTFFTIISIALTTPVLLLRVMVLTVRSFPCVEAMTWFIQRNRFPCGMKFMILPARHAEVLLLEADSTLITLRELMEPLLCCLQTERFPMYSPLELIVGK